MSYEHAIMKMKKLEDNGYLNYGDNSVQYSYDPNLYIRWFSSMDRRTEEYLKGRIREVLLEERVLFRLGYNLVICPHEQMKSIVESAKTYSEMAKRLNNLPYLESREENGKLKMNIIAEAHGQRRNLDDELLEVFCNEVCDETIYYEYHTGTYGTKYRYLHSEKCEDIEGIRNEIDQLLK